MCQAAQKFSKIAVICTMPLVLKDVVKEFLAEAAKTKKHKTLAGYRLNLAQFLDAASAISKKSPSKHSVNFMTLSRRPDTNHGHFTTV